MTISTQLSTTLLFDEIDLLTKLFENTVILMNIANTFDRCLIDFEQGNSSLLSELQLAASH